VFFDVENPMEVGEKAPTGTPRQRGATGGRASRESRSRTDFGGGATKPGPRAIPGRGVASNPRRDAAEPPRNSLRGTDRPPSYRATGRRRLPREPAVLRHGGNPPERERFGARAPGDGGGNERTSKGKQAHGRHGRRTAGNGGTSQRTRQRSKALKSAAPPEGN
jgi:hypothetical protein